MSTKSTLWFIFWSIVLVVAQAVVFNHICLFHYAIPIVFIYNIIKAPMSMGVCWLLTAGFLTGLSVDIFSDTQGMNALACTILAFMRGGVFRLYVPPGDEDAFIPKPSMRSIGVAAYLKYAFSMVLIYCFLIFTIEAFAMFDIVALALRIACSTALTFLIILAIDSLTKTRRRREKKL